MIIQSPLDLGDVDGNTVDLALNPATYFRDLGDRVSYFCDTVSDFGGEDGIPSSQELPVKDRQRTILVSRLTDFYHD